VGTVEMIIDDDDERVAGCPVPRTQSTVTWASFLFWNVSNCCEWKFRLCLDWRTNRRCRTAFGRKSCPA